MVLDITKYGFEVDKDGNKHPEKVDSLTSALVKMSFDSFLIVKYEISIDDRIFIGQVEIPYEEIHQLSEQQILELIKQEIKIKHNLQNY
ncbi:MAG: hypothetical protein M3Q99_11405 [Acidobacteriota bacterium]|nr:hypothetical protein [Acidobacteriota bacterium]